MKTQVEIENENLKLMITKAKDELNKATKDGTVGDLKASNQVLPWYVGELANRIELYKASTLEGKAKVKPIPAKVLLMLDSETIAHLAVRAVIGTTEKNDLISVARFLTNRMEVEYKMSKLKQDDKDSHKRVTNFVQSTDYRGNRKYKVANDLLGKYHKMVLGDLETNLMRAALKVIVMLSECQPIINEVIAPPIIMLNTVAGKTAKDKRTLVVPLPWFKEWILKTIDNGELMAQYNTIMVEKPIDWTGMYGGGFHTERFKYNLIQTRVNKDNYLGVDMSATIKAVNRLQSTKWQINENILQVMLYAKDKNLSWGGLPTNVEVTKMPYPFPDKKVKELNDAETKRLKDWRKEASAQYDFKIAEDSKYMSMFRSVAEAVRFRDYSEIYFCYFLDFRGRIYPKASNLHPQGTKYLKPLLQFAEGRRIQNLDAEMFLAMQGANTFGKDKETFINKHKWVLENEQLIIDSANDPYDTESMWHRADEPWGFLAFCFEWRDYKTYDTNFKSKIAVAMDGSCNGLQHLGAMFKDEVGGRSVNLTNNSHKGDIYMDVADEATRILKLSTDPLAKSILDFGITRKAVKRPVMIVPYAGTSRACREYIRSEIKDNDAERIFGEDFGDVLNLYSDAVWSAIGNIILKGREAMEFLGKAATAIIKSTRSKDIRWTTPNGFLVIQRKTKNDYVRIATPMGEDILVKRRISTMITVDTDKTNISKHKSSIAPNLVHSLDACHLQNTVNAMDDRASLAMIHDSYGTHAASSRELFNTIRREFVNIYINGDILDKFLSQQPEIEVDGKPEQGTLDLNEVLKSEHFFS